MPINIRGKQYVTVAERVAALHEANPNAAEALAIETELLSEDERQLTMKARVTLLGRTFTGHARSSKNADSIEGESPLEVAETSAVGRALGFAGYGVIDSIASADEVQSANADSAIHFCALHNIPFERHGNYYSHRLADGTYCNDKFRTKE